MPGNQWRIPIAILLAVAAGLFAGDLSVGGVSLTAICDFLGTVFLSALKMLVMPLVAVSLIAGLGGAGGARGIGRLGVRTLTCFFLTTLIAILVALAVVNIMEPGVVHGRPARDLLGESGGEFADQLADKGFSDILEALPGIVPGNFLGAFASDDLLGVIFFCVLFGHFLARLDGARVDALLRMAAGTTEVMMRMTEWVMGFAPLGLFALLVPVVAKGPPALLTAPLAAFAAATLFALAIHAGVMLPLLLRWVARVSPRAVYRTAAPAVFTAVVTGSATVALPVALECVERRGGVSGRVSSFVLPLGAVVSMNGTALYQALAAVFLAQAYGLHLSFALQATVAALALASSVSLPGIPSSSLVSVAIILGAIGLPVEAVGVLVIFDRLFEMARAGVNVLGDVTCAALVARLEGETGQFRRSET